MKTYHILMSLMLVSLTNINASGFEAAFAKKSKCKKVTAFLDNRSTETKQPTEEKSLAEKFVPVAEQWRIQNDKITRQFKDDKITDPELRAAIYRMNSNLMLGTINSALSNINEK